MELEDELPAPAPAVDNELAVELVCEDVLLPSSPPSATAFRFRWCPEFELVPTPELE